MWLILVPVDNGAQYCFCNEGCDGKLLSMESYLKSIDVPVAWLSFQGGWWNNKNIHTPHCAPWCVTSWDVNKTKVPMGLPAFQAALDMPLQLYAPYFCADTIYAKANGGAWDFIASDTSLPGCHPYDFKLPEPSAAKAFYKEFFSFGMQQSNGHMAGYEPDFLHQVCVFEYEFDYEFDYVLIMS
jgi:hypothetical protein